MLVSFVHAGLITLTQATGVIMGANIGTTVTGWLVALLGFRVQISAMALPAITLGFFARFLGSRKLGQWGDVLLGFGLLFLGLDLMKEAVGSLKESPAVFEWIAAAQATHAGQIILAVLLGALVTIVVQSSSATMAITMTLAAQGMIDLPTACALILGENIGTTITANLAALGASTAARRTARAHLLFNVAGVVWAVILFWPFLHVVDWLVPGDAFATGADTSMVSVAAHMAAFHTLFNLVNTAIFLPFVRQLAWVASKMVRAKPGQSEDEFHLRFLDTKLAQTPILALQAARSELKRMQEEVMGMLDRVLKLIASPETKLGKVAEEVHASEQTVDLLEKEITEYLVAISGRELTMPQSHEVSGILQAVSDLERMGDHCESLLRLTRRKYDKKLDFSWQGTKELLEIGAQVTEFLKLLHEHIMDNDTNIMPRAIQLEQSINDMRRLMRKGHVTRLHQGKCEVLSGLVFIDMLTSFEKIGDHAFNVAQMISGER
ncbi:MAG: Na/Pi cotransporter family protein [Deltaproteobacteria bacterium]|nr:Na/Pi cotransporter family protein [Deltaproteobacteria bacterium]